MKIAVLIVCLFTVAFALPISKSRHHDDSRSAERKHIREQGIMHIKRVYSILTEMDSETELVKNCMDSRENEAHAHHHHNSHSHEHSQEHGNSHEHSQESPEHASSQLNSESLEDRDEITEQQTLLASSSKSNEDDDNHSDVSKDDDHPDSDESDESHENFTDFPTPSPVTSDSVTYRGDVALYGFRAKDDQMSLERSGKFDSQDVSDEVDSTPDDESREYAKARSLESHERDDKSNLRDSNEVHSASHDTSLEDHSPEKPESVEDSHDHSKVSVSLESTESGEQKKDHSEELQQLDSNPDDVSNQSLESAENHHSTEDHHSVEHHDSVEDNEVIL